jgi:hypothetical protein
LHSNDESAFVSAAVSALGLQAVPASPLVERALDAGFADQAHVTAQVTRPAALPPVRFLKDRSPTVS